MALSVRERAIGAVIGAAVADAAGKIKYAVMMQGKELLSRQKLDLFAAFTKHWWYLLNYYFAMDIS